jgi:hypothetical protein
MGNLRQFNFVIIDMFDRIVDRFDFPAWGTLMPDIGTRRKIFTLDTENARYITRIDPEMNDIKLSLRFEAPDAYVKSGTFKSWELGHISRGDTFALEYNDGARTVYCTGVIKDIGLTERTQGQNLVRAVVFSPTSPWFGLLSANTTIQPAQDGKIYADDDEYLYDEEENYYYGGISLTENILSNDYYKPVPLKIFVYGPFVDPVITLYDENDNIYGRIKINNTTITQGQTVYIDGVNRKMWVWETDEAGWTDYFMHRDPEYQVYLTLKPGVISRIDIAYNPGDSGRLDVYRRQYTEL